ncbi:uncharacterized protein MELLADRAFT_89266 [Melampsora larici-populina 98AG31]|uniref:Uncharacterized protein n=1 Tax=Melampsora larici-populina (strain 98AG31 / pathotype 3-4-7) TaxID=747676 RepID=F4R5J6_MELLP|nr:uncharacterized protein MELLADRAFT_89266 [Melampsora larici-populina 98AG31]EGG12250.1 hypothetical protein MELLADRAFT_89266 [Melampsora larici-populina 98AG31]
MQLTGKTLRDWLGRYKSAYIKARNWRDGTGAGTDENGVQRDLTSINKILEDKCPCFEEMDAIFKDKPNVVAFGILDSGVDNSQQDLPGTWILQLKSPSEPSQHPTEITHVSDSDPGPHHPSGNDSDGLPSDHSSSNKSDSDNGLAHDAHDAHDDDGYTRPTTQQESYSALQRVIKSFKEQEEQEQYDFRPLPPPIEPPANYKAFSVPAEDEENEDSDEIEEHQEKNGDDKENEPMDIDKMEVDRLLNEDVEANFIPSDVLLDSDNSEIAPPPKKKAQPSQQASQKRTRKSNEEGPGKKKSKQVEWSHT